MTELHSDNPFINELHEYLKEYEIYLNKTELTKATIYKHTLVITWFLSSLEDYEINGFEDLTVPILKSKFHQYIKNNDEDVSQSFLITALKRYFEFIYSNYNISTSIIRKAFKL